MSQLTVTVLQLGLLAALWLFVLGVVAVLRRDLFGARAATPAPSAPSRAAPAPAAAPPPVQAAPAPLAAPPPAPARQRAAPHELHRLVVTEGPLTGTTVALHGEPVLLGRSPDCTLVLGDDYASGHHARIAPARDGSGGWVLEDLGSTNGTTLGRGQSAAPVRGAVPVGVGSVVRIGRTSLELR